MSNDITVILTCYRRTHLLRQQIEHLRNQTIPPKEIWVWSNFYQQALDIDLYNVNAFFDCTNNWKYNGRFAAAMLARTKYIAIIDDDTMPGSKWFENCLNVIKTTDCILGGVGVILNSPQYYGHTRVGWCSNNEETLPVDLAGHSWFCSRDTLQYFWREMPPEETGEDIHFSYMAQKYGNIFTFIPPHPANDKSLHSSLYPQLGVDNNTISVTNHAKFFGLRNELVKKYLEDGWVTVNKVRI